MFDDVNPDDTDFLFGASCLFTTQFPSKVFVPLLIYRM